MTKPWEMDWTGAQSGGVEAKPWEMEWGGDAGAKPWEMAWENPPAQPDTFQPGDRVKTTLGYGQIAEDGRGIEGVDDAGQEFFIPMIERVRPRQGTTYALPKEFVGRDDRPAYKAPIPAGTPVLTKGAPRSVGQVFSQNVDDQTQQSMVAAAARKLGATDVNTERNRREGLDMARAEEGAFAPGGGDPRVLLNDNPLTPGQDPIMVKGIPGRILTQVAAVAGGTVGAAVTPENYIAPGRTAVGRIAGAMGANAATDAAAQGLDVSSNTRDEYDPAQTATAAALGGLFQGAIETPGAIKRFNESGYSRTGEAKLTDIMAQDDAANRRVLTTARPVEAPPSAIVDPAPPSAPPRDVFAIDGRPVTVIGSDGANLRVVEVDPATAQPLEGAPVQTVAADALRDVPVPNKYDKKGKVTEVLPANIVQRAAVAGGKELTPTAVGERIMSGPREDELRGIMTRDKRVQITKRAAEQMADVKKGQQAHAEMQRLMDQGVPRDEAQNRAINTVSRKNWKEKPNADAVPASSNPVRPTALDGYPGVGSVSEPAFDRAQYMGAAELDAAKARDARGESVESPPVRTNVPQAPDRAPDADIPEPNAPRAENVQPVADVPPARSVDETPPAAAAAPDPEFEAYKTRYKNYDADRNQFASAAEQKAARVQTEEYVNSPEFRQNFDEYQANKNRAQAAPDAAEDAPNITNVDTAAKYAADRDALSATKAATEAKAVFRTVDEARAAGASPEEAAARVNAPDEPAKPVKGGFDMGPKPEAKPTSADIPALDQRVKDLRKKVSQAQRAGNAAGEKAWKAELAKARADLKAAKAAARKNQTNAGAFDPAEVRARQQEARRREIDEELAQLKARREAADAERKAQEAKERAENAEAEKERLRQEYAAKYNVAPKAAPKAAPEPKPESRGILTRPTTSAETVRAKTVAKREAPNPEAVSARRSLETEVTEKYGVPMSTKSPLERAQARVAKAQEAVKVARGIPGAVKKAEADLAAAKRALREVEAKEGPDTGTKLYSNPVDPDLIKKGLRSVTFRKAIHEWSPGDRNRAAIIKTMWQLGKSTTPKDVGKAVARTVQLLRGSDIGALRMYERWTKKLTFDAGTAEALGIPKEYVGEPIVRWIADQVGTDPGSGRKIGQSYQLASDQRAKIKINQLGDLLRGYTQKERDAAAALLANTKFGREVSTPRIEALRTNLRGWLDDQYEYLVDAGVKINNHADYYTRIPDRMAIEKDPSGFIEAATEVYKARGMDEAEAGSRAVAYFNSIMYPPSSRTRGMADMLMGSPDHSAKRVFGKEADELLAPYYIRDPLDALTQYAQRTSMLAEQTRRFGYNGERLAAALDILRREMPNNVEDFDKIVAHVGSARGMLSSSARFPGMATMRGIGSWVQVWGSLRFLARTSIYQITEPLNVAMRSHNLLNAPKAFFTQFDQYVGLSAGSREAAQFAHVIGVAGDAAKQLIMDAYSQGIASELPRRITTAFFDRVLTGPITEAQRIVALRIWRPAFEGMLNDVIEGKGALASAKVVLGEYGINEKTAPAVRAWLDKLEDMAPEARYEALALDMSEPAKLYRAAMHDFALKSILEPTLAETPHYAKHPLGQMAYAITSFMYAATREIRNRAVKSVGLAFGKDVDLASRVALLTPLMGYAFYGAVMTYVNYVRQNVFAPNSAKDMTPQDWLRAGLSATGIYGTLDPLQQVLFPRGRYEKDISTLFGLDFPLAFAQDLGAMWNARPWSESNSPDTNTAEYNGARAAYSAIIAPAAAAALSVTPLPGVAGLAGAGATMHVSSRRAADDFATAVAGPKGMPTNADRETMRTWRRKQAYKDTPRGRREAARDAREKAREARRRRE